MLDIYTMVKEVVARWRENNPDRVMYHHLKSYAKVKAWRQISKVFLNIDITFFT